MTAEEYKTAAIERVRELAAQKGIKYRFADFSDIASGTKVWELKDEKGIAVALFFLHERCGTLLKKRRYSFLQYANCRVLNWGVVFEFSYRELEIASAENVDDDTVEKVITKIQKLLELANTDNNPTEHEAIAASMKAQQLMAKYNIHYAQINGEVKNEELKTITADGCNKEEARVLAGIVAEAYRCKLFIMTYGNSNKGAGFYGYESDALVARQVFVYLNNVANRFANARCREAREAIGTADGVYRSYYMGFCDGVKAELMRNCKALMLVVPDEVKQSYNDIVNNENVKVEKSRAREWTLDSLAYNEGFSEGKHALNAQYIGNGS